MSYSQKKGWPSFSFSPKVIGRMNGRTSSVFARTPGKMIVGEQEGNGFLAVEAPPLRLLIGESSSIGARGGTGEAKEGKGLDNEGFPEDAGLERRDKDALAERIEELEKELYDYQYHMGLLLIEKKMQTSEFEELRQGLAEARENLKLERASFYSTLSEKQMQEQCILTALEAERQHVVDLEKTIYKMQAAEKYLARQRETLQSWEPGLQEHELELKESQNFLGEMKMDITNKKDELSKIKEEIEGTQNIFVRMNNASNYGETGNGKRQQTLASKEKEAESKQEKLEKKERDLLTTQAKLATGESALQSEKQVFDQELEIGRESLDGEFKYNLNKLVKQNAIEGEYANQIIDDLLTQKNEVEDDKVEVQNDKKIISTLYSRLQNFKQELFKKMDLLLSLPKHSKTCKNCSVIFSEIDLGSLETLGGAELADDILLLTIPTEHLEKRMKGQNDDASLQSKGYQSVKTGGCMPCLQQCSELCNFNSGGSSQYAADGNERKATVVEIKCQPIPVISHDNLNNKRVEPGNGAREIEIIERFPKVVHSPEQYSDIANVASEIECQPNASFINEQNESHALSSKAKRGRPRPRPNKRTTGSMKTIINVAEATLKGIPKERKKQPNSGTEDLKDANEESKLNLLNADKMGGSAEQQELLSHASGTAASEMDSGDSKTQPTNEGHHKRQKTSDIGINFHGQKRYNLRPSTILKVSISQLRSGNAVLERDSDETDIDYEPTNSD